MAEHKPLRHVPSEACSSETAQTPGMQRTVGISSGTAGSTQIFLGQTVIAPGTRSAAHHHGDNETGIYVLEGAPVFHFAVDGTVETIRTKPGDYVLVPPHTPHVEENPSDDTPAVVLIARSAGEAVVVNLDALT